jgi:hypothetical protein
MPKDSISDNRKSLPIFSVEVTCSRQWGDAQQNHLDSVVEWSARLTPVLGIKLVDKIITILNEMLPGALSPISEGGARALDALGKEKQLRLLSCELRNATGT